MTYRQFTKLKESDMVELRRDRQGSATLGKGARYRVKVVKKYKGLKCVCVELNGFFGTIPYQYIEFSKTIKKPNYMKPNIKILIFDFIKKFIQKYKN